jgi:hypothetical protein
MCGGEKIIHEALGCRVGKKSAVKFICRPDVSIIVCQFNGCCVVRLPLTVFGLAKEAIFTIIVDAENQTLINHKCVCGALNRHFCQTRVSGCSFCRMVNLIVDKLGESRSVEFANTITVCSKP